MCLAVPGKVVEIRSDVHGVKMGKADFGGVIKEICLEYTPEAILGDYVLVHVGFALEKIDQAEAHRMFGLFEEIAAINHIRQGKGL